MNTPQSDPTPENYQHPYPEGLEQGEVVSPGLAWGAFITSLLVIASIVFTFYYLSKP